MYNISQALKHLVAHVSELVSGHWLPCQVPVASLSRSFRCLHHENENALNQAAWPEENSSRLWRKQAQGEKKATLEIKEKYSFIYPFRGAAASSSRTGCL